ncbi:MAG: aspartate-semialdehyde dehydrogenase [Candidatus Gastranaerophilales bacterium]|nr:aspartate-semialdehyde dehydrogenase [Candidatus Gastranaerophilales bacterium]
MTKELPNIAVLGATGVVGREILNILQENNVQYKSIKFLASARSAGSTIEFKGEKHTVIEATPDVFEDINICLASAGGETSKKFAPIAASKGCVFIDNSSAFRMDKDVPLVIAGVNDEDLRLHKGIIANPNCSTSQLMLPLKALDSKYKVKRMVVSTYQAVSGAGLKAINELTDCTKTNLVGMPYEPSAFKYEIAFNVIPQIDSFCENGYTKEEMKVTNETRKILHFSDDIKISCTAVRVPVYIGHSESVSVEFENPINASEARELLKVTEGVEVIDDIDNFVYPTPKDAAGKNPVYVGRIRNSIAFDNGLEFFCVADNLRIGAALNTVRIAEKVISMELY